MISAASQSATDPGWWQTVPAIAEMIFWTVVGSVTVVTYRHARRTVLQPLRTEVYKQQIKEVGALLRFLIADGQRDLESRWGINEAVEANIHFMYNEYARRHFGLEIKRHDRENFRVSLIRAEGLSELGHLRIESDEDEPDPSWQEWKMLAFDVPNKCTEAQSRLVTFMANPLLPKPICDLLDKLSQAVRAHLTTAWRVIESRTIEMEAKYPTIDDLNNSSTGWIYNDWNHQTTVDLDDLANEIVAYCRNYFAPDIPALAEVEPFRRPWWKKRNAYE